MVGLVEQELNREGLSLGRARASAEADDVRDDAEQARRVDHTKTRFARDAHGARRERTELARRVAGTAGHCPEKDTTMKKDTEGQEEAPARRAASAASPMRDWQPLFAQLSGVDRLGARHRREARRATTTRISRRSRTCARSSTAGSTAGASRSPLHRPAHDDRDPVRGDRDRSRDRQRLAARAAAHDARTPTLPACCAAPARRATSESTVVIRRFPGRRNASAAFTHLAA